MNIIPFVITPAGSSASFKDFHHFVSFGLSLLSPLSQVHHRNVSLSHQSLICLVWLRGTLRSPFDTQNTKCIISIKCWEDKKKKEGEEEEEAGIFLKAHICSELNLAGFTKSEKQLKEHNTLTDENLSRNLARICASVSLESGCD